MRGLACLAVGILGLAAVACGGHAQASGGVHDPAELKSCLDRAGASVLVNPAGHTFQVGLGGSFVDVVLGANGDAASSLAEGAEASSYHPVVDRNVAYWKLVERDGIDDAVHAIGACLAASRSRSLGRNHDPALLEACLEKSGATVAVGGAAVTPPLGSPKGGLNVLVRGMWQVSLNGETAIVVIGRDEWDTMRVTQGGLGTLRHPVVDGNVAYSTLDGAGDTVRAIAACLE